MVKLVEVHDKLVSVGVHVAVVVVVEDLSRICKGAVVKIATTKGQDIKNSRTSTCKKKVQ